MKTKNFVANSIQELKDQIQSSTSDFQPTLGILFCSLKFELDDISNAFNDADIDLIACSSAGEILNENIYSSSIVCVLTDMKKEHYKIVTEETKDSTYQTAFTIGNHAKSAFDNPAVILVSGGVAIDGEKIILGIRDSMGREIPIFGGLAGDDLQWNSTYALSRYGKTKDGFTALIIDNDKIEVQGLATCGWEPIGNVHTITKAKDNVVYTINDQPALDVFLRHFGYFDNGELEGVPINTMSAQYPLQILRDGDYSVLRSPLFSTENKTLILGGGVKEGDKFRFSISPGFEVIDKTVEEYNYLKAEVPEADLMILFSCKGRHAALGPLIEDEIEGIAEKWDAPLIGLFTYGEIGNVKNGVCDFHNETCSMVLLKEK